MNEYLRFYNLFNFISPFCIIFVILSVISLVISIVYIFDYSSSERTKNNFKILLTISAFILLISSTILGLFSYKIKSVYMIKIANDCEKVRKVAIITNDEKLKVKYFDICVKNNKEVR